MALHTPEEAMTHTCPATMSISWTSNLVSDLLLCLGIDFASLMLASSGIIADALESCEDGGMQRAVVAMEDCLP